MAHPLIGFEWFQWNSSGSSDPREIYPILVVVATESGIAEARKRFVVSERRERDYRFVTVAAALKHLDAGLADAEAKELVGKTLANTRARILQHFGHHR